ncbi:MAG: 50S ribosomal protein L23 [Anaerolineae bacterium]|nr:50S ribosomal protein L23 [Anaerolineae bacterium]MDW8173840.1 50S ribosomal protein L23 [Anaerolineae bacterium]
MPELHPYDVIRRPVITEKTNGMMEELNQYVFEVDPNANKIQIKDAVELVFDVPGQVVNVRTMIMPAKRARRGRKHYFRTRQWKKAIVTLTEGTKLQLFNV